MSLTKYEILLKTAECGSFTRAAQELNFTQSGISHAVSSLEAELGTTLVVRSHGGVSPGAAALLPGDVRFAAPAGAEGRRPAGTGHRSCAGGHLHQRVGKVDALYSKELSGDLSQDRI